MLGTRSWIGPGGLDAVDAGHADVHEHDVGGELLGLDDRLFAVLGLGDDVDALFRVQDHVEPAPEQGLVVGDHHPDDAIALCGFVGHRFVPLSQFRLMLLVLDRQPTR